MKPVLDSPIGDGGPAFPVSEILNADGSHDRWAEDGMSLRDYFAAKAMAAFGQGAAGMGDMPREEVVRQFDMLADFSYLVADSMLKAKAK